MKKVLFIVALMSVGTTLINAMTSVPAQQTDVQRNQRLWRQARESRRNVMGSREAITGEDVTKTEHNDDVSGEDVTKTEQNGY